MPEVGVEPTPEQADTILNRARLPIPPLRLFKKMVELRGFEPLASTMPLSRAPNCATAPLKFIK